MIKCEKMRKISFNFILFCAFIAVVVSWYSLSSLHSAHNLIYHEESGSCLWSLWSLRIFKCLQWFSVLGLQKYFDLLLIDRMDTINPMLQFLECHLLKRNNLDGKEHDKNSSQVDSGIILLVLTITWHHNNCGFQPCIASHPWLALPFCLENTDFSGCDVLQGSVLCSYVVFIIWWKYVAPTTLCITF